MLHLFSLSTKQHVSEIKQISLFSSEHRYGKSQRGEFLLQAWEPRGNRVGRTSDPGFKPKLDNSIVLKGEIVQEISLNS